MTTLSFDKTIKQKTEPARTPEAKQISYRDQASSHDLQPEAHKELQSPFGDFLKGPQMHLAN